MKLNFPALFYFNGDLFATPDDIIKIMGISFPDEQTLLCKEEKLKKKHGWILQSDGQFVELDFVGQRRTWAKPLSFLWRFTLDEYKISNARTLSVGELRGKLSGIKDKFKEAPVARDLRQFLAKYDEDEKITADVLKEWNL